MQRKFKPSPLSSARPDARRAQTGTAGQAAQPVALDDKQLKQVAGGTGDPAQLPKGGW